MQNQENVFFLHQKINTRYYKRQKSTKCNMFLVQDIRAHQEPIWAAKFSPCGFYLATGGKDGVLKIWSIIQHKSKHFDMANSKIH